MRAAKSRRIRAVVMLGSIGVLITAAGLTSSPATASGLSCPSGPNLCIPPQGANEGVTGVAGDTVVAGYDFTIPGTTVATTVFVQGAYERLTVSCANGSTPTAPFIDVPMPDATYTVSGSQDNKWTPSVDHATGPNTSYEGSVVLTNLCGGGTIKVGQPGQMMFVANVGSDQTNPINFRSHYNDSRLSKSGSWSATKSVVPPQFDVYAGYADNNHSTPPAAGQFPNPWEGSPDVSSFEGCTPDCTFEGGTVRFTNFGTADLMVSNVEIHVGNCFYSGWAPATLAQGKTLIVAQMQSGGTSPSSFQCTGTSTNPTNEGNNLVDTSDLNPGGQSSPNGCTVTPYVKATINGKQQTFTDSQKVITDCLMVGANESEQWQVIS